MCFWILTHCQWQYVTILYRIEGRLAKFNFEDGDIWKIIKSFNVNKAHGHDDISIRLLKICDAEVVKSLLLIVKNCIQYGIFPNLWKKSNIEAIHEEGDKQCMFNYLPVLLLPICGKVYGRLIFNPVLAFLDRNKKTNYSPLINLVFVQRAPVKINYYKLYTIFMQTLIKVLHLE